MSGRLIRVKRTLKRLAVSGRSSRFYRRWEAVNPDLEYVVVVTFGRSGSTLVQGLLNTMPRTLVRGENGLYLWHLFKATKAGAGFSRKYGDVRADDPASAFYGLDQLTRESFVNHARAFAVRTLLGDVRLGAVSRLGFKEVKWHLVEEAETEAFFRWMDETFPGIRYVLNVRDTEATLGSGFWQHQERDEALAKMERVLALQDHLTRTRRGRTFLVRYEDLTSDDETTSTGVLKGLATFVTGGCDDQLLTALRTTMSVGHGPNPFGKSRKPA